MKKGLLFWAVFLPASFSLFLSCEKEVRNQSEEQPLSSSKIRIVPTLTRVTETQFETGDAIGVHVNLPSGPYADNVKLVYDGTAFSGDLEWYTGSEACDFYAYFPYSADYYGKFTVQSDQSSGLSASDFIVGELHSVRPTEAALQMTFRHLLSRLEIQVNNHSGKELSALKICGARPDTYLEDEPVEITPFLREGKYYAIIPPQDASLVLSFSLDGEERTAEVASSYFVQGAQHTITLTLDPETGLLAALTGEIDGWGNRGSIYPRPEDFYPMFKDGYDNFVWSFFSCSYFLMSEMRSDNVCQSSYSIAPFTRYTRYDGLTADVMQIWPVMIRIINNANYVISRSVSWDAESAHRLGEAYFFRAFSYFTLVNFYARPYSVGKEDTGFPLRTESGFASVTVEGVYDQVVADLRHACELMSGNDDSSRDHGYVTSTAAKALLSRVYLYMEKNEDCIAVCDQLLQSAPAGYLTDDLANYFKEARTNPETIWCIAYDKEESLGKASVGSLYYSPDGVGFTGWAEFYWSDPLIELFGRYPQDRRFYAYFAQYGKTEDGTKMIHWPIDEGKDNRSNALVFGVAPNSDGTYSFTYDNTPYTAARQSKDGVNNGYPQYFIKYQGVDTQVFVRDNVVKDGKAVRNNFPAYMMTKFSGQDGDSNLSSPVILRWAEVLLNRAEALAKTGNIVKALADVNVIRNRAGLSGEARMTVDNYQSRGYESVLDVVLDERRMEFCFEGHRYFDVFRNKMKMDRRYAGYNRWEVISYTDPRIPYSIPDNQ